MIEILMPILLILAMILFKLFNTPKSVYIIIGGLCMSELFYYIATNATNANISKTFIYLTLITILLMIILLIVDYIERITNKKYKPTE